MKENKSFGCPETSDGTGADEAEVVTDLLQDWDLNQEVCATSSNTGAEIGACKLLEDWLGRPILGMACRHHVYELHIKRMFQEVTGSTKGPGVLSLED